MSAQSKPQTVHIAYVMSKLIKAHPSCIELVKMTHETGSSSSSSENHESIPGESYIHTFVTHLLERIQAIDGVEVVSFIYLERLLAKVPELKLNTRNWQSLVTTAILLASKVWDDLSAGNFVFAEILPFSLVQINEWERKFLAGLDFDVSVSIVQFNEAVFRLNPVQVPSEIKVAGRRTSLCPSQVAIFSRS